MAITVPESTNAPGTTVEEVIGQPTPEVPANLADTSLEQLSVTPSRDVASNNPWSSIDKKYGVGSQDPVAKAKVAEDMKTSMRNDILTKMVDSQSVPVKGALQFGSLVTTSLEDVYNTGVAITNFADKTFGDGENLAQKSNAMASLAPQGTGWEISREIGKFMVGYSGALKGIQAIANPATRAGLKGSQAIAGATTEFLLAKPELESLTETFVRNVPFIGDDVYGWLNDPEDSGLEARAKAAILGVAEGEMAEQMFKGIKMLSGLRKAQKSIDEVPPVTTREAGEEGAKKTADTPPPIPEPELPPLPEEAFIPTSADIASAKNVVRNKTAGVNEARFIDSEGNAASINLTKFDTTDDLRKTVSALVQESPEQFGSKKYTTSEISEIASDLGMTPDDLNAWSRETGLHIGQIKASAHIALDATDAFANTSKRFLEGLATEEELAITMAKATSVVSKATDMKSMAGLLLKEADIPVTKGQLTPAKIREITKVFGDDATAAAKAINDSGLSNNMIMRAIRQVPLGKLSDRITNMRHASNLSNPATHARNMLGGFTNTALRPGETLVAATINAIEKNPRGVQFSDAYHELAGMSHGFMDALNITANKLRGKQATFAGVDPNKAKVFQSGMDAQNLPEGTLGRALDFVDKQIVQGKFVGDALRFEDNFVKHVNAMMTLRREAYRKARFMKGATPDEKVAAISEELANPTADTVKKMYKDSEYATLTNDLSQGIAKSLVDVSTGTAIGRLIAPYAKVNLNAMMYKFERIPGVNLLLKDVRANLNSVDPVVRQTQLGRMAFASTTMASLAAYLHQSDAIIGSGPKDSKKYKMFEQAGYQRNSVKVGDSWVEFRRETPVGGVLGLIADGADLRDMVNGDNDQYETDAGAVAVALIANLYNPEYLTSVVSDLFKAMADNDVKSAEALISASVSVGTQFTPYAGAARQYTRQVSDEGRVKREVFDPSSVVTTFMNRVKDVYAPAELAIKRNILGDPILHKTGFGPDVVSPFGVTQEINDPIIQELAKLSGADHVLDPQRKIKTASGEESKFRSADDFIDILMPQKSIRVGNRALTMSRNLSMDEYEELVLLSSGRYEGGIPLKSTLSELFKQDNYKKSSQKMKGIMVKSIISKYHDAGRKLFQTKFIDKQELEAGLRQTADTLINQ